MRIIKYWSPTILWMAIIFYFSSRTKVTVSEVFFIQFTFFKSLHVIEYMILYTLSYRSCLNTNKVPLWQNRYNAFLLSLTYAVSDEIHQVFVPTREGALRDIGIDAIGITLAMIFIWKYLPQTPKILKQWAKILELI